MTAATIQIDDHEILNALASLARRAANLQPTFDDIGAMVADSIRLNFREQHDPNGNPWQELSATTLAKRRQGGGNGSPQILRDTGRLMSSITHNATAQLVEIGTDVKYANMMHYGGKKADFPWLWGDIPERPFVGISDADHAEILAIILRDLAASANN